MNPKSARGMEKRKVNMVKEILNPGRGCAGLSRTNALQLLLFVFLLSSCICGGGAPKVMLQYAVDYPPPSFSGFSSLRAKIGVARFSIARSFRGHDMIYSTEPFRQDAYNYARWIADPGDMVGDHFLRDLRASGLFEAVYSYCDPEEPRYSLQGSVERVIEIDRDGTAEAVLAVNIILIDRGIAKDEKRIIFQKMYRAAEKMAKREAAAFAAGASSAAARLSKEIISDVYQGVRETLSQDGGAS